MNPKSLIMHHNWPIYLVLFVIGVCLYVKTWFFDLTYLDDNVWIVDYLWYLKDWSHMPRLFIEVDKFVSDIFYRPMIIWTFMVDAKFSGSSPMGYHITNTIIHAINGCLIFKLFCQLKYERLLAFFIALIFVVHPVLTQAVAWIPGRTDSLLALFVFSSYAAFLSYIESKKARFFVVHLMLFALALLTKETAVMLSFVFLAHWYLIEGGIGSQIKIKKYLVGWGVITIVWLIIRKILLIGAPKLALNNAITSVFENLPALLVYLGKICLPFNLSVLPTLKDSTLVFGAITLWVLIALFFIRKDRRINYVLFGIVWFGTFILPSLVISFLKHEYRVYVPLFGLFIVLAEMTGVRSALKHKKIFITGMVGIVGALSAITFFYSEQYQDRMTFWSNAVKHSPHAPLAQRNLGAMYHLDGQINLAEARYLEALSLNQNEYMVNNNLGLIAAQRGQVKAAEDFYLKEIAINPTYENVYYNLGILYFGLKRYEDAEQVFKKSIELNPRYIASYKKLFALYVVQNKKSQAQYYAKFLMKNGIKISKETLERIQ